MSIIQQHLEQNRSRDILWTTDEQVRLVGERASPRPCYDRLTRVSLRQAPSPRPGQVIWNIKLFNASVFDMFCSRCFHLFFFAYLWSYNGVDTMLKWFVWVKDVVDDLGEYADWMKPRKNVKLFYIYLI